MESSKEDDSQVSKRTEANVKPSMETLMKLAKQQGFGICEIKKSLPEKLINDLRKYFLGDGGKKRKIRMRRVRKKTPKKVRRGRRAHDNKKKFFTKKIADTLMLRRNQRIRRKNKTVIDSKKDKQFRLFGISLAKE